MSRLAIDDLANPVLDEFESDRVAALRDVLGTDGIKTNQWLACLVALLASLQWNGIPRFLSAYLPKDPQTFSFSDLLNTLSRLGYVPTKTTWGKLQATTREWPVLLLRPDNPLVALGHRTADSLVVHNGWQQSELPLPVASATVFVFHRLDPNAPATKSWFKENLHQYQRPLLAAIVASLIANILALVIPLFTMTVYDTAIPSRSFSLAVQLGIGALIAIAFVFVMRWIRNRILTYVGGRLGYLTTVTTFERLISMPFVVSSRSTKSSLIARFRDLDGIREFFSGPLAAALLDFPFVLIFLIALGVLAGWLVFVPIISIALFAAVVPIFIYYMRRASVRSAWLGVEREELQLEGISNLRALVYTGEATRWLQRFESATSKVTRASRIHAVWHAGLHAVAHTLSQMTVLATLAFGIFLVVNGQMTAGGLIAAMMFIGRITAPIQTLAVSATSLSHLRSSTRQVDRLMELQGEFTAGPPAVRFEPPPEYSVTFDKVSFRYSAEEDLVLTGVSFEVPAGSTVAVLGPNGCGKSTVLRMIAGVLTPQSGRVLIGGHNLRQYDPIAFRSQIGFSPDRTSLFGKTMRDNLRLVCPNATDDRLMRALDVSGAFSILENSPAVLDMKVVKSTGWPISDGVADIIGFARAVLMDSPLILLDQPRAADDARYDQAFSQTLDILRERGTVFYVTHNLARAQMADQIIVLNKGSVSYAGPVKKEVSMDKVVEKSAEQSVQVSSVKKSV